jgi:phytoene desaturase
VLIPLAVGIEDTDAAREVQFIPMINRLEKFCGTTITNNIIFKKSYCLQDFKNDYNAYKGNAYGLANTLRQTAILKPSIKNKKIKNLYYCGQLTVPGPGVPPALISAQIVAKEILKNKRQNG